MRATQIAMIAGALSLLAATVPLPADAAHADDTACPITEILALRGSGETQESVDEIRAKLPTNDWEGATLRRALNAFADEASARGQDATAFTVNDFPNPGDPNADGYQSIDVLSVAAPNAVGEVLFEDAATVFPRTLIQIHQSALTGTVAALKRMSELNLSTPPECAVPRVALLGYSQGALAARSLYGVFGDKSRFAAVVSFGDPIHRGQATKEKQASAGLFGRGATGTGIFNAKPETILGKTQPSLDEVIASAGRVHINRDSIEALYTSDTPRLSVCHEKDPFCDHANMAQLSSGYGPHENYVKKNEDLPGEISLVGGFLADALLPATPDPAQNPEPGRIGVNSGLGGGRASYLVVDGFPAGATLKVDIVRAEDGTSGPAAYTSEARPVQSYEERREFMKPGLSMPGYMDDNTHIMQALENVERGIYYLRITDSKGHAAFGVTYGTPAGFGLGGEVLTPDEYEGKTEWLCSQVDCDFSG